MQWQARQASGGEHRAFELNADNPDRVIINSTELRLTNLEMDLVTSVGSCSTHILSSINTSAVTKARTDQEVCSTSTNRADHSADMPCWLSFVRNVVFEKVWYIFV